MKNKKLRKAFGNTAIKNNGHDAVIRYEATRHPGWSVKTVEKDGVDLVAYDYRNQKPIRYIEVKSTGKKNFEWREFESAQHKAMLRRNHYVYFVRKAGKPGQQIKEVKGSKMKRYFHRQVVKYLYAFPMKSGFHKKGWASI